MPPNLTQPTTPAPAGISPLNGFATVNAQMNPGSYFNPNYAMQVAQSTPVAPVQQAARPAVNAAVQKAIGLGEMISPAGAVGAVAKAAGKFAPAVVQVVRDTTNPNSAKGFMRIPAGQLPTFNKLIDNTGFLRMPGATAKEVYHLTYKSPEQMLARGFEDLGVVKPNMIPKTPTIQPRTPKGLYDFK